MEKLGRQERWQKAKRKLGLCPRCGKEPLAVKINGKRCCLGLRCLKKQRERAREQYESKTRYRGAASYQKKV